MPRFAANLGHLFTERPLLERFGAAAAAGFAAVELQFPYDVAPATVKAELERHGLTQLGINTPQCPEFGLAALPGRERDFDAAFKRALDYVVAIGGPRSIAWRAGAARTTAGGGAGLYRQLTRAAAAAAKSDITLLIEPINPRDRPDYFLRQRRTRRRSGRQDRRAECAGAVRFLSRPDHRRRSDAALRETFSADRSRADRRGADAPRAGRGRDQLSGDLRGDRLSRLQGWIGCEYKPRTRTEDGLGWAKAYGVVPKRS